MELVKKVDKFLGKYCKAKDKLLLGLSGGADSTALLYILLDLREKYELHLAHVDHGWREESGQEALELENLAKKLKLPFYLKKLDPSSLKGNLEDACRNERMKFFSQLVKKHNFAAVLLAHHADDNAETVLKRLFEGANVTNLFGIREKLIVSDLTILRPLLQFSKNEILKDLKSKKTSFFDDKTNKDTRFLRARMREEIIPYLSKNFGKEIRENLCRLSVESKELNEYLEKKVAEFKIFDNTLDLSKKCPKGDFELKFLLKNALKEFNLTPSRDALETFCTLIRKNASNKMVIVAGHKIRVDKRQIFFSS